MIAVIDAVGSRLGAQKCQTRARRAWTLHVRSTFKVEANAESAFALTARGSTFKAGGRGAGGHGMAEYITISTPLKDRIR